MFYQSADYGKTPIKKQIGVLSKLLIAEFKFTNSDNCGFIAMIAVLFC